MGGGQQGLADAFLDSARRLRLDRVFDQLCTKER